MHRFHRGLSPAFLHELLSGRFAPIMVEAKGLNLDIQIRDDYVDFYAHGRRVLQLTGGQTKRTYRVRTHWKYLVGIDMLRHQRTAEYCHFDASDESVGVCLAALPKIIQNALALAHSEARIEEALIHCNAGRKASIHFIDRQIQVPEVQRRADLLGLSQTGGETRIVIAELKQGLDNRIQELIEQVDRYRSALASADGRLRADIADSYRTVLSQKRQLGLLLPTVGFDEDRPIVETLLILYGYKAKSRLLDRLRTASKGHALRPHLVLLNEGDNIVPARDTWETLL